MFVLRKKRQTVYNSKANRFRPFAFRYLQADAHRQKVRIVCQLDGGARDAVIATTNCKSGAES